MARVSITYLFWTLGGLFGLHHIYLGRLTHAIFFNLTLGFCGLGFIYDFFYIPQYVKQANSDPIYLGLLRKRIKQRPTPSIPRLLAIYVASYIFSHLSLATLGLIEPIEARIGSYIQGLPMWWTILTAFVQSIGILVGCLFVNSIGGQRTVSREYLYLPILLGTIADVILAYIIQARMLTICRAIFPTLFYARSCEWLPTCADPKPRTSTTVSEFINLFAKYIIFSALIFSFMIASSFFYCDVTVNDNGTIQYSDSNYGLNVQSSTFFSSFRSLSPLPLLQQHATNTTAPASTSSSQDDRNELPKTLVMSQLSYNYTIFETELLQFYADYSAQQRQRGAEGDTQTTPHITPSTKMNQFTLPKSYRLRDVFRNIALSPIFSSSITNQPLQLFHYDQIPTTLEMFAPSVVGALHRTFRFVCETVQYVQLNGVEQLIDSLDVQGKQWAANHFVLLARLAGKPRSSFDMNDVAALAVDFIASNLKKVNGHVAKLPYQQQRLLFETIVAFGRVSL